MKKSYLMVESGGGDFVTQNLLLFEPGYILETSGSKELKGSTQGYYACNYFS